MGVWYDPSRDGTIEEHIKNCRDKNIPINFKGHEQFEQLVNLGYIEPHITAIRIMYNDAKQDEHYGVIDDFQLEGIILNAHSGKQGIHNPKDLLSVNTPHYEVIMINPFPEPQKTP